MTSLQKEEEKNVKRPHDSCHVKDQDYDEKMLMVMVVTKNERALDVQILRGLRINIITNPKRKRLNLTNIKAVPFCNQHGRPKEGSATRVD